MILGVDYAAERWPDQRWPEDARLMKEAGVGVARIAHSAWAHIEVDDNYFNLRWLNRVMDILFKHGIRVVVCLPTEAPPPWLVHKFPEVLPMDAEGRRLQPGTFNHRCFLNKHYRDYTRKFTMRLSKEIWGHRAIIGWQIDGGPCARRCYCETCHRAFLEWLAKKYGKIERVNQDWGTAAGGQEYLDFEEIPLPWRRTGASSDPRAHNPSLVLDFWRFSSEAAAEFVREQAVIVRRHTTRQFITVNCDIASSAQNCFEFAPSVDFFSCENMPLHGADGREQSDGDPFRHDLIRGLAQKNYWVLEHQIGATGWNELGPSPHPGQLRVFAWQTVGHGADGIVFSPWRSSPSGAMQLAEGVLGHDGVPRRHHRELKELSEELARVGKAIDGTQPGNAVAIAWDFEQVWALQIQRQTAGKGVDCTEIARAFHAALRGLGLGCDIVGWQHDFAPYQLLFFPPQYLIEADRAKKVADYVSKGGRAVFSTRSGIKNYCNINHAEPAPALLRELLGIEIVDADVLAEKRTNAVRLSSSEEFEAALWCDVLELKGAEASGRYTRGFYKETPAVTARGHGKGKAYYVASVMNADFYRAWLTPIAEELGLRVYKDLPADVQVVTRRRENREFLFVTNHSGEPRKAVICRKGRNLLDDSAVDSTVMLEPYGVAVIEI